MHLAARCSVAVLVGLRLGQYQAPALHHDLLARGRQVLLAAGEVRHGAIELVVRKELRQIVGPDEPVHRQLLPAPRSEERRVGQECGSTRSSWWSRYH